MLHRTLAGLIVTLVAGSGSSGLSTAARPTAVEVELLSVSPGTPSGDGDWCVDAAAEVTLTAHVVDLATQSEVTQGTIEWQDCESQTVGLPKENCDGHGPARWVGEVISDLSGDSTPSLQTRFVVPVLGFRVQFRPTAGSNFKRATSVSFNLDRTCS
jgi:hypothetical protein